MATKQYQWRAATKFASDTSLSYGVTPSDKSNWQTATIGQSETSQTWTWWYRDANTAMGGQYVDALSSRVAIEITESWTTSVDNRNNLTVTVRVTIDSVVRDDLRGNDSNLPGRVINFYREEGGSSVLSLTDNQVAVAHTIYGGPLVIDEYSFTIAPGEDLERSTLYCHNQTAGYSSYDDIWLGVQFRNILPADYRPKAVYANGQWNSCNRDNGRLDIYTGSSWQEMRTVGGPDESGDPPEIYNGSSWKNQRLIGNGG